MSAKKQLIIFLLICLPVTWIIGGISIWAYGDSQDTSPMAYALSMVSCFVPAIAAIICSKISKEGIRSLNILPKLEGNGKVYAGTIFVGLAISLLEAPIIMCIFFPGVAKLNSEISSAVMIFQVLLAVAMGCVQFFVLMGEEIGWMGFLFPKLESICGTNVALVITGIIRGLWHMVMLYGNEDFAKNLITLMLTNIVGGCLLVLLTKKSGSVVPASVCHALNNTLPSVMYSFIIVDAAAYAEKEGVITAVSYIPYVLIMGVCWIILMKKYKVGFKKIQ